MNVRAYDEDGLQLIELMVVVAVIAIGMAVGLPSLLGESDKAHDSRAKQSIAVGGKLAKLAYIENGYSYPETKDLPALMREQEGTDTYSYRAHIGYVSTSTGPDEISVRSANGNTLYACVLSSTKRQLCGFFRDPSSIGIPAGTGYGGSGGLTSADAPGNSSLSYYVEPPADRLIIPAGKGYATAANMASFKPTFSFEVGAWVLLWKKPSGGDSTIASHGCTWSEGANCVTADAGWALAIDSGMRARFNIHVQQLGWITENWTQPSGCRFNQNPAQKLELATWHYVSAHYDPLGAISVYVDGKRQECSGPLNGRLAVINTDSPLMIGAQVNPAGNVPVAGILEGAIAELRMTQGDGPAHPLDAGPRSMPGAELQSPAENARPATFLFHFNDRSESMSHLDDLVFTGEATLGY